MVTNQHRNTAGKTLIAFAILAAVIAAFAVYLRANRERDEYISYPTGLGDQDLYDEDLGPGFDLFHPNLVFDGLPEDLAPGLYLIKHNPIEVEDSKMRQFAREKGNRHWVYAYPSKSGNSVRFFLKAADNRYIEFGKQKYFPEPGDKRPGATALPESSNQPENPPAPPSENSGS